jgi:hypothetical protein
MQILKYIFIFILLPGFCNIYTQKGLIGYWDFDTFTSDLIKDSSPYSNNGSTHETVRIPGVKGKALDFNGSTSFAEIHDKSLGD